MLSLKQSLSLNSIRSLGSAWQPSDEGARLIAWYKNKEGIILNGSDVSKLADSSGNEHDMVQATASEQPAYNASTGALTFDSSATQNLQSTSDIELSGEFTVGIRLFPTLNNVVVIADNNQPNEFFKIMNSTDLRFKTDNNEVDLSIDSGSLTSDMYLVITRNASNLITLHKNGVAQADTEILAGTAEINAIGVRRTDNNPYNGTISEIQIFNRTSIQLTLDVNNYLSSI